MSKRNCGPCTACCQGWLVSEKMEMKPGTPCKHCSAAGCGIYEDRPAVPCASFECAWLKQDDTLPDEMRPDICGAIVMLDRRWKGIKVIAAVPTGEEIPPETLEWLRAFALSKSTPLIFCHHPLKEGEYGRTVKTGFGPPGFVKAVKEAIGGDDVVRF